MFDHDQNRNNAADRFYLSAKEERLAWTRYENGVVENLSPDPGPRHDVQFFKSDWRSAQYKFLGRANEYLAHNVNGLGRGYDKFNEPKLVEKAQNVEEILSQHLGSAPEHAGRRQAALDVLVAEPMRGNSNDRQKEYKRFIGLAVYLNRHGLGADQGEGPGEPAKPFDPRAAKKLSDAVGSFQSELVRQVPKAPPVNTAFWLDDLDAVPDPKFKPDYAGCDDDDSADTPSDNVKPLFRGGRPSDSLERFPDGVTVAELEAELNRVRRLAREREPAIERRSINPVFTMNAPAGAAPVLDLTQPGAGGPPPQKRQRLDGMAENSNSPVKLSDLGAGNSEFDNQAGPSTSGRETRERIRGAERGL